VTVTAAVSPAIDLHKRANALHTAKGA